MEKNWKYYVGITLVLYSFFPYIFSAVVLPFLPVSNAQAVSIATVLVASGEIGFLVAVALLGKPFVQMFKAKIKGYFRRAKTEGPSKPIGRTRHTIGLVIFLISLIAPYLLTEIALYCGYVENYGHSSLLILMLSGDALFVISLFVLGDEFWARLKHLFEWPGKKQGNPA